jgi:hypothetical protein
MEDPAVRLGRLAATGLAAASIPFGLLEGHQGTGKDSAAAHGRQTARRSRRNRRLPSWSTAPSREAAARSS